MILILAAALASQAAPAASQPSCPDTNTAQSSVCRALQSQSAGDHAKAAAGFEAAANASPAGEPATARMWAAAGNMWIAAGEPGKAALALDRALAGAGLQAEQRGEALLDRARAAEAQDDLKTARAKLNEASQTIGDQAFFHYFSAALAIREGDAAAARSAINRALSLAPADPLVVFEAGHVAHFEGDIAAARAHWTRAAELDPDGPTGQAAKQALALLTQPAVQSAPQPSR